MRKKFLLLIYLLGLYLFPQSASANCNFKTGNYINHINNPKSIELIDIKIPNSKAYNLNMIKILLSESINIPPILRKKFSAIIKVKYSFGNCEYKGKIWQNGDWRDHIKYNNGLPVRSLNVRLNEGNIINAIKFKLLLPETRNGYNEILGVLIAKRFGIISPETFQVPVSVNNNKIIMIFQEDSQKEMLERNKRREGPIFEGDERGFWSNDIDKDMVPDFNLAKIINKNWSLTGENAFYITLNAYSHINNHLAYKITPFYDMNLERSALMDDFHFFLLAMNGFHASVEHNRKYFYNTVDKKFEPIYYDGDLKLEKLNEEYLLLDEWENNYLKNLGFYKEYKSPYKNEFLDNDFVKNLENEFKDKVISYGKKEKKFFNNSIKSVHENIILLKNSIKSLNKSILDNLDITRQIKQGRISFLKKAKNSDKVLILDAFNQNNIDKDLSKTNPINNREREIFIKKLTNSSNQNRYLFLPEFKNFINNRELISKEINSDNIYFLYSNDIDLNIDQKNKEIFIKQLSSNAWILIKGVSLDGWQINFNGIFDQFNKESISNQERINLHGLTGCLNIYDSYLKNISIEIDGGSCEDSLNVVNSSGSIKKINVKNAFQDGIDIDFSKLTIDHIKVNYAGNDCLDVSAGDYKIEYSEFSNCRDKSLSVGEKSTINLNNTFINDSEIGIAVKDYSIINIRNANIKDTKICISAFQKKQEFGGSKAKLNNFVCDGEFISDNNSIINYNNEF